MSYTNVEMVRKHIGFDRQASRKYRDFPVIFEDSSSQDIGITGLVERTLVVKAPGDLEPIYEEILPSGNMITLQHDRLIPGSVTAASNNSLNDIYIENVDFSVNCDSGNIILLEGGRIASDKFLSIWYYPYLIYQEGNDYSFDYSKGTIHRLSGGMLNSGQAVLLDFECQYHYLIDSTLDRMVAEANAAVEKEIDPNREFGADATLQAAATYLAAALVCRTAAADSLRSSGGTSSESSAWLKLAGSFRDDFERLVRNFRPGATRMNPPRHT